MISIGAKDFLQHASEPKARPEKRDAKLASESHRAPASSTTASKEPAKSFADDLESMHRNLERNEKPGREEHAPSMTREGERKDERDSDTSHSPNPVAGKKTDEKHLAQSSKKIVKEKTTASPAADAPVKLGADQGLASRQVRSDLPMQTTLMGAEIEFDAADDVEQSPAVGIGAQAKFQKLTPGSKPLNAEFVKIDEDDEIDEHIDFDVQNRAGLSQLEKLDVLGEMQAEQTQVRQESMQGFLNKMQSEFGIAPDKIVEAFTQMDQKTLMGRPEESTVGFMKQLQSTVPANVLANPKAQARIEALYQNMVETTSHAAMSEKLIALQAGDVQQLPGSPEEALEKLAEAMDEIDAAFGQPNQRNPFDDKLKSQLAAESMNAKLSQLAQQNKNGTAKQGDEKTLAAAALATGIAGDMTTDTAGAANAAATEATPLPGSPPAPLVGSSTLGGLSNGSLGGGAMGGGASSGGGSAGGSGSQGPKVALAAGGAGTGAGAVKAEGSSKKIEAKVAPSGKEGASPLGTAPVADENVLQPTQKATAGTVAAGLERPQASSQEEQDNVRELIHQAQVVLKKGGGEIKMDLKPEGAGQVHLKVSVIDGQVNVQMLTENEATKHLLEKSLHELKSGLASHDLKLENLKVDVSQGANKNMDMDKQGDDQARQQARQFANDVMGQFRDERQAFQQGFMENPGWRQYGRPQNRANMSPESVAGTVGAAEAAKRMRSGGSSRLNLVA